MAQITELKHEDKAQRRTGAFAVAGAALLVTALGVGWFVSQNGDEADSSPAVPLSTPSATATSLGINLEPGETVGTRLNFPLVAKVPDSWTVYEDGAFVWVDVDGMESTLPHVDIDGPLSQVFDPERRTGVPIPPEGYANWLREHPNLDVMEDRMVTVDGDRFPQLTMMMAWDAPGDEVALGASSDDPIRRPQWPDFNKGEQFTLTVIEVDGKTMVVTSAAQSSDAAWEELDAGHELVLSTMKLPN